MAELRVWLLAEHGVSVSTGCLWTTLDRLDLTHKNVWPAPSARVKLDGVLVCINVSGLKGRALAKMGSARSRPHKVRGVEHHIFGQAAGTPVRPLSHLSFTSTDLVRGSGVDRPLSLDQAITA
jgi:hypothetical protein